MQLETGKSKYGLVGSLRSIIREEGYERLFSFFVIHHSMLALTHKSASGDCTEVRASMHIHTEITVNGPPCLTGLVPPLLLEAPKRAVKLYVRSHLVAHLINLLAQYSAANDFWGKTYLGMTGQSTMTQQLSVLTGCSAGATESFVVVPFELVKVKYVCLLPVSCSHRIGFLRPSGSKTKRALSLGRWMSSSRSSGRMGCWVYTPVWKRHSGGRLVSCPRRLWAENGSFIDNYGGMVAFLAPYIKFEL
jgi:hypothetical protein